MAKIRVYELAKDLKMTNKALLSKMKELKIEVKSHMSSLQDSDISKIKKKCLGKAKKKKRDVENIARVLLEDILYSGLHYELLTISKTIPRMYGEIKYLCQSVVVCCNFNIFTGCRCECRNCQLF